MFFAITSWILVSLTKILAMKKSIVLGLLTIAVVGCTSVSEKNISEEYKETPHDFMFMQRAYPTGEIRTDAYTNAISWKREKASRTQAAIWEFAGPVNIGGRITDIEIPIDQGQTYYVGAASGGIFKTTDGGGTWNPIFDGAGPLSIGDMEISKADSDVIWVGTGEVNAGGGSLAYDGDGVYYSSDGGLTWESKGLPDVGSIGKVLIDPNDANTVFVGAMGPLFRDDTNRGVYRSTDGGTTWEQVLFVSDITGVIDMANHPTNSDIIYATSWERERRPQYRDYGGETSRVYRSLDGGDTWSELTNGLPGAANKGRISIDIAQSNPDVLYTRYTDANGSISGVYRTSDGGDSWIQVNSSQLTNVGFHWWFRGIFVDPSDENTLYNVDFVVEKSTDGGQNWSTAFPNVHVDQHAMAFNTVNDNEVLLGNDGGLYKSVNDGATSVKDLTLPITQFYRFYVDPQDGDKIYGGSQDNNTIRTTTGGLNDWTPIFGGDGFQSLVDATNTNVIYALSQNGNLGKSVNDAASFFNATSGIAGSDRNNWDTPITFDPQNSDIVYYGTQRVWQSTNAAGSWTAISADLTNGSGGGNLSFGTIISIDVSPLDSDVLVVGTDDGNVWITQDGGGNWTNVSTTLPNLWTTKVLADRADVNAFYVTFSGYRYGEDLGHVFKTEDAGVTWTDIGGTLPDIPVNDIVKDRYDNLFLGTDIGVFASADDGVNWAPFGDNMPEVVVTDMHIHEADELLYAATYGRSAYKVDIANDVLDVSSSVFAEGVVLYPNPASDMVNISISEANQAVEVIIYDALGRLMHSVTTEGIINISQLNTGVYYVKVVQGKKQAVKKLLVK